MKRAQNVQFLSRALWDSHQTPAQAQQFPQQLPSPGWLLSAVAVAEHPLQNSSERKKRRHQMQDCKVLHLLEKGQGVEEALEVTTKTRVTMKSKDDGALWKHTSGSITRGVNWRAPRIRACRGPVTNVQANWQHPKDY